MTEIPIKALYTPHELAKHASVSRSQVYRLMQLGLIVHVHIRKLQRIPRDEFVRVLREGLPESKS